MKAILTNYKSPYYPVRIDWDHGKKSIVVDSVEHAIEYIRAFLPLDTAIIDKTVKNPHNDSVLFV